MQRLILTVIEGTGRGHAYVVTPGDRATIGREQGMAIRIDDGTAPVEAEIDWTGTVATLTVLGDRGGVWVNGVPVTQATLHVGDEVQFGRTLLSVAVSGGRRRILEDAGTQARQRAVERSPAEELPDRGGDERRDGPATEQGGPSPGRPHPPAAVAAPIEPHMILAHVEPTLRSTPRAELSAVPLLKALLTLLPNGSEARLYAVVDGAQAYEVAFTARLMGRRVYTLFSGEMADALSPVGPCLIDLDAPGSFLELWSATVGTHAGVLLQTLAPLETLYQHLRSIFVVNDESDQEYFFRFYDPRVLLKFLPTCTPADLEEFFGPVLAWIAEDAAGTGFVAAFRREGGLVQTPLPVPPAKEPGSAA